MATADVDPASNAGALYFAEAQYVTRDDAAAGNALNNASYRRVTIGNAPNYNPALTGTFFEQQPAINAWKAQDPTVMLVHADTPAGPSSATTWRARSPSWAVECGTTSTPSTT